MNLYSYAELTYYKNIEDDGWYLIKDWVKQGCPSREPDAKPGDISGITPEELDIIQKHGERPEPGIIAKGEMHVRKVYFSRSGSRYEFRCNLEVYLIAEKYKVFPPDKRDLSSMAHTPSDVKVYNQY